MAEVLHATAIAVAGRGVLIRGPSGSGKSDLALRCLAVPAGPFAAAAALLVADDQVEVAAHGGRVRITAPAVLRGLIEVRGIGIVEVACAPDAELALVADIVPPGEVERMPAAGLTATICGIAVPYMRVDAHEASAPIKLLLALAEAGRHD